MGKSILPISYFERRTLQVARGLLGKYLVRKAGRVLLAGRIVEVEAYVGPGDQASHASRGVTRRTEVMFGRAGVAYVYLIYGMHHCFNVVTDRVGYPAAILVRAISRAGDPPDSPHHPLIDGPGRVCRMLQIDRRFNGIDLTLGKQLWIEDRGERVRTSEIGAYPRIGVDYAGRWASKPWRLRIKTYGKSPRGSYPVRG